MQFTQAASNVMENPIEITEINPGNSLSFPTIPSNDPVVRERMLMDRNTYLEESSKEKDARIKKLTSLIILSNPDKNISELIGKSLIDIASELGIEYLTQEQIEEKRKFQEREIEIMKERQEIALKELANRRREADIDELKTQIQEKALTAITETARFVFFPIVVTRRLIRTGTLCPNHHH